MEEVSSYSQSSTSMEQVLLLPNLSTIREEAKKCCKFTYRPRHFKNKGATLLLVANFFVLTIVNIVPITLKSEYFLPLLFLTMPIAGWLSDVYFGRYKVIYWSVWIMWIASILAAVSSTVAQLVSSYDNSRASSIILFVLLAFQFIGLGAYQANILQLGLDQLYDASTNEIISFISWYFCSLVLGYLTSNYVYNIACLYLEHHYSCENNGPIIAQCFICICLSMALIIYFLFHNTLKKETVTQSPYKLIYGVIKYAIKNKHPRCRSAFTYCEDELPSRIDFGKSKYGGPFTTEQVEDVKTFLRLLVVTSTASVILGETLIMTQVEFAMDTFFHDNFQFINDLYDFNISYLCGPFLIALHEFLIYPTLQKYFSWVTSRRKIFIGVVLLLAKIVSLMVIELMARDAYLKQHGHNVTLECIVLGQRSHLSSDFDSRWLYLPNIFGSMSLLMLFIGTFEFLCAQSPHSMRGLLFGVSYGNTAIFATIFYAIQVPFSRSVSSWGTGIISCEFWYFLTILLFTLVHCVLLFTLLKFYKNRKREDVLPNEHIFAERYYSKP